MDLLKKVKFFIFFQCEDCLPAPALRKETEFKFQRLNLAAHKKHKIAFLRTKALGRLKV
jgi:hypothetical protein